MRQRIFAALLAALAVPCAFGAEARASSVFSNSFAPVNGDPSFSSFTTIANPGGTLSGGVWTVTTGSVDWIHNYWQSADSDGYSVDLDGDTSPGHGVPGKIEATFPTEFGHTYSLSFWMSGNFDGQPTVKTVLLSGATFATSTFFFDTSTVTDHNNMQWVKKTTSFVATSNSTTLGFSAGDVPASSYGAALDNVLVTEIPLPAGVWGGGALIAGLGIARKLRRMA